MFGGEKRRVFCRIERPWLRPRSSGRSGPVSPENIARKHVTFRACLPASSVVKMVTRAHAFDVDLLPSLGGHIWRRVNAVGHHDNDAASVLGTVQGAALRSARACARPSGLDGACAQMIGGQLCDGRRMLFPSGTNGALIDPSDGLEKSSRIFDRFRTRAFHSLAGLHFLRF